MHIFRQNRTYPTFPKDHIGDLRDIKTYAFCQWKKPQTYLRPCRLFQFAFCYFKSTHCPQNFFTFFYPSIYKSEYKTYPILQNIKYYTIRNIKVPIEWFYQRKLNLSYWLKTMILGYLVFIQSNIILNILRSWNPTNKFFEQINCRTYLLAYCRIASPCSYIYLQDEMQLC